MSELALQLIAEAKRTDAKVLDLGNCGLTELPDELFELTQLEELNLCNRCWDHEHRKWVESKNKSVANCLKKIDLSISNLKKLKTLRINGELFKEFKIIDLSFLKNLTSLKLLDISNNSISDCSILQNLTNLQELYLSSNLISDCSFLQNLTSLKSLDLSSNEILNCSFLKKLTNLQSLYFSNCQISDLSFLKNLTNLKKLYLYRNEISDVSFLQNLTNLRELYLRSNKISNISFLQNMTDLQELDLLDNKISDISFLQNLTNLKMLDLNKNKISDVSFLQNLITLHSLDLTNNKISDISFLQNLSNLQALHLGFNQILNITPLLGLIEKDVPVQWENKYRNSIVLGGNPLIAPPPEVIIQGNQAISNWFKANKKALNELKLILIGDPQAGKTSILRRLIDDIFIDGEKQTDGVNIESLRFKDLKTFKDYTALQSIMANCWDFGGQETMNATHQFFMTKRCIYILVLNARKDNQAAQ